MSSSAEPSAGVEGGSGRYVYGVVPATASDELLHGVGGVDVTGPVALVADGELAAIASTVPLAEFGEDSIERNLHDEAWLEEKVRAHEAVLEAVLSRTSLVPFRFGTIYRGDEQVRRMLRENAHLKDTLGRLRDTVELGVKAFLDSEAFERRQEGESGDETTEGGRAYLLRKQRERQLVEARASFIAACAQDSHAGLTAAAEGGRANPVQRPEVSGRAGEMLLNGAYLVRSERVDAFDKALADLRSRYEPDGVRYELTGPWPPYNFVEPDPAA